MTQGRSSRWRFLAIDALGVGGCVVLSLVAVVAVVLPVQRARRDASSLQTERVQLQQQLADLDQEQKQLQLQLARGQEDLAADRLQLVSSEYLNTRMARIVELASASGLDIHEMRPGHGWHAERYEAIPIGLSGRGMYSNSATFLHELHETLPDMGVVEFKLSGNPANPGTPAAFRFDLIWYAAPASAKASS